MIRIPQSKNKNAKSKKANSSAKSAVESAEETSDEIYMGMQVEARFGGKGDWSEATVMKEVAGKGGTTTYNLQYTDGRSVSACVWRVKMLCGTLYAFMVSQLVCV